MELLMKDLGTLAKSLSRYHPPPPQIPTRPIGTSHERLMDFGWNFAKNTCPPELELLMKDFR